MSEPRIRDIFRVFTVIGALSFGGPYAILAYIEREIVTRRAWLDEAEFTKAVGIGSLTPGPIAYSAAVYIGYRLKGIAGAVAAGVGLTWPAFVCAVVLAVVYERYATLPSIQPALHGFEAAIVGLLAAILWRMSKPLARNPWAIAVAVAAFAALLLQVNPAIVIIAAGVAGILLRERLAARESGGR